MDQVDPDFKLDHPNAWRFKEAWQRCKLKGGVANDQVAETSLKDFSKKTWEMQDALKQFNSFLNELLLVAVFGYWLKGISSMDDYSREKYLICFAAECFLLRRILSEDR